MYRGIDVTYNPFPGKIAPAARIRDVCYEHLKVDVIMGRFLGLFIFNKSSDGTYTTRYRSHETLYSLVVMSVMSFLWGSTLTELLDYVRGDRVTGSYILFILLFNHPITFIAVAEAKKINEYLTCWMKFQVDFRRITGTTLEFRCRNFKLSLLAIKVTIFVAVLLMLHAQFPGLSVYAQVLICYYYLMMCVLTSLWYIIMYYLYKTGEIMHNMARSVVRDRATRLTMSDVEVLWIDLYKLTRMTGRAFCFTYCYFILTQFLGLIVTTYEALLILDLPITWEKAIFALLALTSMTHTASIPFASHQAIRKIGEEFYKLLVDLKIKTSHPMVRAGEMDGLLQAISDNQPLIDLGGFVTLDNGLITSLMSTMVTYLIVLVQFRV